MVLSGNEIIAYDEKLRLRKKKKILNPCKLVITSYRVILGGSSEQCLCNQVTKRANFNKLAQLFTYTSYKDDFGFKML